MNAQPKTYLIFEPYESGHREEYMKNLLSYIANNDKVKNTYIFSLNKKLLSRLSDERIPKQVQLVEISKPTKRNKWDASMQEYKLLNELYLKYNFDEAFVPDFYSFTFAALFKKYKFKVSGILFKPYNPQGENSFLFRLKKNILYYLISRKKHISKIFILNNNSLCQLLNKSFHTNKFVYLVDPVATYLPRNKNPYSNPQKNICLHFGALDDRKGIFTIFDSISKLTPEIREKLLFAFVGKPSTSAFASRIEQNINLITTNYPDICIDYNPQFVSNEQMEDYYQFANCILIPYKYPTISSGVLGHAAKWGKYIIGNKGVVGDLIDYYHLGKSINPTSDELADAISSFANNPVIINKEHTEQYMNDHSVSLFSHTIFN